MSPHFNGEKFFNPWHKSEKSFGDFLKWNWNREKQEWPQWVDSQAGPAPVASVVEGKLRYTVVNHASVLVQGDGINVLTDPIWSERCSPWSWVGPKRVRHPGLKFEDLPEIHMVVISHNHYDHMDLPTLKKLNDKFHPVFLVGLGNAKTLENFGIERVIELDWWQSYEAKSFKAHFVPAQHFSSRSLWDRNRTLWGGFVLNFKAGPVFFAGDTGYGPHFKEVAKKFPGIVLSFIPIGAYEPRWFMSSMHVNPEEAVQAHIDLGSQRSVGVHFGTFQLTDEAIDDPVVELQRALDKRKMDSSEFETPTFGEGHDWPPAEPTS